MFLFWILLKLRMVEVVVTTEAISHAKFQSNHRHQQTNTQLFTGRIPFLSPNQQYQSTEGKKTTLPREIHKSHFSSFQQYSEVRNVKAAVEKLSKAQNRFRFLHRRKDLHCYSPWTCKTIECTLPPLSEGMTSVQAVFCMCTCPNMW